MSDALLPCPFCGESAAVLDYGDLIQCGNCGCVGPYGRNQIRGHGPAVKDWNTRHPSPAALSEEEREALEVAMDDCEWRSQGKGQSGRLRSVEELAAAAATIRALLARTESGA